MSTSQIANDVVQLCRTGRNMEAIERYYADSIVSVESAARPGEPTESQGIEAVRKKNQWWFENNEIHSAEANGPMVGEKQFAIEFKFEFTRKESGQKVRMNEVALYTVEDGKIVREHFFYNPATF